MSDFDLASATPVGFDLGSARPVATAESFRASNPGEYDPSSPEFQARYGATSGNSFLQNSEIGVGKLYTDVALGTRQLFGQATTQDVEDKRATDQAIMETGGGKFGEFAGALPLALFPGANSYAGAAIVGGALAGLQPVAGSESRAVNTAAGAGTGVVSKYIGDSFADWIRSRAAQPFTGWRQATVNDALAQKLKASSLDSKGMQEVASNISAAFSGGRNPATNIDLTQQGGSLARTLTTAAQKLNPSGQAEFAGNSAVSDLMAHLRAGNVNAQQLGQISSDLYEQAGASQDKMVRRALFAVRNQVEDLIQNNISDQASRDAYAWARGVYPTWKAMERPTIFNSAAGNLNPRNLGSYLQKNDFQGYVLGQNQSPLYNAARWGQETRMGNAPPVPIFQFGKWLSYHATNNPVLGSVGGAVSRTLDPVAPVVRFGFPATALASEPLALTYLEQ